MKPYIDKISELIKIKEFPGNIEFFFILPSTEQYRNEDYMIVEWSEKFNLKNIGRVYNTLNLYKVNNY